MRSAAKMQHYRRRRRVSTVSKSKYNPGMTNRDLTSAYWVSVALLLPMFLFGPAATLADPITEDEAVEEIVRLGGKIERSKKPAAGRVVVVSWNRGTVTDEQLIWLKPLTTLTTLDLYFSRISDAGL